MEILCIVLGSVLAFVILIDAYKQDKNDKND